MKILNRPLLKGFEGIAAAGMMLVAVFAVASESQAERGAHSKIEVKGKGTEKGIVEAGSSKTKSKYKMAGIYEGVVESGSETRTITTCIVVQSDGRVSGIYVIDQGKTTVGGHLVEFSSSDPLKASFIWQDDYGSGTLEMIFSPDYKSFSGSWTPSKEKSSYKWNGYKK